jgi:hypothetical protein
LGFPGAKLVVRNRSLPSLSTDEKAATVDATIPHLRVVSFDVATDTMPDLPFTFEALQTSVDAETNVLLRDNAHGLFRLWFILVDGEKICSPEAGS